MASHIKLLLALVLVVGCYSAPHEIGFGFRIGGQDSSDVTLGGNGIITQEGKLLSGAGSGLAGAKWKGGAYAGGYTNLNNHTLAGKTAVLSDVGIGVRGGLEGKIGQDKDGRYPIGLTGTLGHFKNGELGANAKVATGEQGSLLSELYRDSGFDNPNFKF